MNELDDIQLPYTVEELIKTLDKVFPEKAPDLKDSERTVWGYFCRYGSRLPSQFFSAPTPTR